MMTVFVRMSLVLAALMVFLVCATGDTDTVRTIGPPALPSLPLLTSRICPRPGLCPQIRRLPVSKREAEIEGKNIVDPPSLCGNLCTRDEVCPAGKKCCPTTCGYACYDPVFVADAA
ncbi:protein WAP-3-like [Zootermopsis nevadensis]|uniref:protein WAP-3-like n=1 Tax=Zootermopsis nevadensis TaxID=136037 RepID=UPI000B8ED452|nr:protein WAP-3-like [Zootermopsis nevadensis]